jgi:hypothetical protein
MNLGFMIYPEQKRAVELPNRSPEGAKARGLRA